MSEDFAPRRVQIGERQYTITRFKGLKASIAGALISRVMREQPRLQQSVLEFTRQYRSENTIVITPAMAKLPRYATLGLTPDDFKSAGGSVEFPDEPDPRVIGMHIMPEIFEVANREIQRLFALLVISNRELEEADDADSVEEALSSVGKTVIREGYLEELIDLLAVGLEVIKEQMASRRDALGKLNLPPWLANLVNPPTQEELEEIEEETESSPLGPTSETPEETDPQASPSSVQPSSGDSPQPSDGTEEPLSTVSPGTS